MSAGKVIDLDHFRLGKSVGRTDDLFLNRFGRALEPTDTPPDLPDDQLAFLIGGRGESADFLQEVVIRLLDLGRGISIHYLSKPDRMLVMDAHFYLLDQLRFEAMRRLGWLVDYPGRVFPIALIAGDPEYVRHQNRPLELAEDHPAQAEYRKRMNLDGEVVIRRLIPAAIKEFCPQPE